MRDLKLKLNEGRRGRGGGVWRIEAVALLEAAHAWRNVASGRSTTAVKTRGPKQSNEEENNIHGAQAPN